MCDYLLFENATGYALFEVIEAEDIGTNLEKVSGSALFGMGEGIAVCLGRWHCVVYGKAGIALCKGRLAVICTREGVWEASSDLCGWGSSAAGRL